MIKKIEELLEEGDIIAKIYYTILGGSTQLNIAKDYINDPAIKNEVVMLSKEIERVAKKFLETSKRDN